MLFTRFKDIREDSDKTQKDLAEVINTSRAYYNLLENGKHPITLERALQIAEYYNISLDYLTGRTNKKEVNK